MTFTQMVSPILNDALALAEVSGEEFLAEFKDAHARERRLVSRRSKFPALRGMNISARLDDEVIVTEVTLAPGLFVDESRSHALIRLPLSLPCTIDAALPGRALREVIGHRLITRSTSIIEHVTLSVDSRERLLTYAAPTESLRKTTPGRN